MKKLSKRQIERTLIELAIEERLRADPGYSARVTEVMKSAFDKAMGRLETRAPTPRSAASPSVAEAMRSLVRNLAEVLVRPSFSAAVQRRGSDQSSISINDEALPIQPECRPGTGEATVRIQFPAELDLEANVGADATAYVTVLVNTAAVVVKSAPVFESTVNLYLEGELSGRLVEAVAKVSPDYKILVQLRVEP